MAPPLIAICPACKTELEVDPLGDVWPKHTIRPSGAAVCPHSGAPMPHQTDGTLQTKGTPVITVPDSHLSRADGSAFVALSYNTHGFLHATFPSLNGVEAVIDRAKVSEDGAVVVVRLGEGFLAPRVTLLVEFPQMPSFATPDEADEWLERMERMA